MSGDLAGVPLNELLIRRTLGKLILKQLRGPWADDPRAAGALIKFQGEMQEITAEIQRRRYPDGPPAQTIGLKTQSLTARRY